MLILLLACSSPSIDTETDAVPVIAEVEASLHEEHGALVEVRWQQLEASSTQVRFAVDGEDWSLTAPVQREAGEVSQWVAGLPLGEDVVVQVVADEVPYGEPLGLRTDDVPDAHPIITSATGEDFDADVSYVLLSLDAGQRMWTFIVDRQGRVVWTRETPRRRVTLHPRLSADGTQLLVDDNSFWAVYDGGAASELVRLDLTQELEVLATPGLHHPFTELPDGTILWMAYTDGDDVLTSMAPGGEPEPLWSCLDFATDVGLEETSCGSNTVWWDPESEHVLVSLYSLETIVEMDADGAVLRWFGHAPGAWGFDGDAFWWQHGAYYTDEGTLLLSSKDEDGGRETVAREYALGDETLELIWEGGTGEGVYGDVMGEAHRLQSGNTLHNLGSATRVREYDPDGNVVWDLVLEGNTMGRSTPITDLQSLLPEG